MTGRSDLYKAESFFFFVFFSFLARLHYFVLGTEWTKIRYLLFFLCFQARIAFLQGERKGQENLKKDLVRRIKMLEYALKQER